MKYSIGEFANLLGVTVDTLRLYEKEGIIKPIRDNKNNYRYFNDLDARDVLTSRWYRSLQLPLRDVALMTKNPSIEMSMQKFQEVQLNLEEEIRVRMRLLEKIAEINRSLAEVKESLNICQVKKTNSIYRIKQTNGDILLQNEALKGMVNTWMEMLPYTFYSFRIDQKEIQAERNPFNYTWGLAMSEEDMRYFKVEVNEHVEYISAATCISSVIFVTDGDYLTSDRLKFMFDYVKERAYDITGDIFGKIIFTEKKKPQEGSYLEVNIPISS